MSIDRESIQSQILRTLYRIEKLAGQTILMKSILESGLHLEPCKIDDQLGILENSGLVGLSHGLVWLTEAGRQYVLEGMEQSHSARSSTVVGHSEHDSGNLQSVGNATNNQVSQIGNDLSAFEALLGRLLMAIRDELQSEAFSAYEDAAKQLADTHHNSVLGVDIRQIDAIVLVAPRLWNSFAALTIPIPSLGEGC